MVKLAMITINNLYAREPLKEEFPDNWFYTTGEGASHGFIHPTPWDSTETEGEMSSIIFAYGLNRDILPRVSIPLIIHHACGLADWVRELKIFVLITFTTIPELSRG
jgi:hypothetical protein